LFELGKVLDEEFELASFFEVLKEGNPEVRLIDTNLIFFHVKVYLKFVAALGSVFHKFRVSLRKTE
jgi:hypothetical protein